MRILGFDTATTACSVALWEDGRIVARRFEHMPRGQSERLMPMVLEVMTERETEFTDLDLLAVTNGPGAFTGLRIGLAAARGMALAGNLPCLGVTTLAAVAAGVPVAERQNRVLLVVLESKRADIYAQIFAPDLEPHGGPEAILPDDLPRLLETEAKQGVIVVGDAAERALEVLIGAGREAAVSSAPGTPDAATVAILAAENWSGEAPPALPRPLYLRPPDATRAKNGGRLRP